MRGAAAFVDRMRRTTHKCYDLYSTAEMLTTRDGPAVIDAKARYWSKIAIFVPVRGPRQNIAIHCVQKKNMHFCFLA